LKEKSVAVLWAICNNCFVPLEEDHCTLLSWSSKRRETHWSLLGYDVPDKDKEQKKIGSILFKEAAFDTSL